MKSESAADNSRKEGWVKRIRSSVTDVLMVCLFATVIIYVIDELQRDEPVIDVIDVPKEFSDWFYTDLAITRQLIAAATTHRRYSEAQDPLERLPNFQARTSDVCASPGDLREKNDTELSKLKKEQRACAGGTLPKVMKVTNTMPKAEVPQIWDKDLDIQLPTVGSLRSIIRFLKTALHVQEVPHITGEITTQKDQVRLVLRSTDVNAVQPDPIYGSDIDEAIKKGGEILLQLYSPCSAAFYYYRQALESESFSETDELISETNQLIKPCRKAEKKDEYADLLAGLIAYQKGAYEVAIKQYNDAIKKSPKSADIYFYKGLALQGLALRGRDNPDNARVTIDAYKETLKFDPNFVSAYWGLAFLNTEEADNVIRHDLEKLANYDHQKAATIYVLWGNALLDRHDVFGRNTPLDRRNLLEGNTPPDPHNVLWRNAPSDLRRPRDAIEKLLQDAIEKYEKAIQLKIDFIKAYDNWGVALYVMHENGKAIEKYSKAIEYDSHYADAYYNRGIAYLTANNSENAVKDFEKFHELKPETKSADLSNYWGNALLLRATLQNDLKPAINFRAEAIEKYKEAIAIDQDYYPAYYNLAVAYLLLGNRVEANNQYLQGDEAKKRYDAEEQYRVAQQNNPSRVPATSQETEASPPPSEPLIPYRLWPWAGGLVAFLVGLLVIFFRMPRESGKTPDITPPPRPPKKKSVPQRRKTQVERHFPAPEPGRPAAILVCVAGTMQNRKFPIEKEIFKIGADSQNDLRVRDDEYISGNHAYLRYENGNLFIYDERSRNGTFVNGQQVFDTARALMPADRIKVGNSMFEVVAA